MNLPPSLRNFASRLEFGDLPILVYFAAFIRQYLFVVGYNTAAWLITVPLAGLAWFLYVTTREERIRPHWTFWVITLLPLAFIFSTRFPYPDTSFDVLSYHLLHSERAMSGVLNIPGDIFLGIFPGYDPAPDMITGISRWLFGFRLGVVINLAAVLWAATIIDRILRSYVPRALPRALAVLACVAVEHVLAEINNYMVDLLVLPLLLEATWMLVWQNPENRATLGNAARFSLLLGFAVGLKLTNLAFAIPVGAFFLVQVIQAGTPGLVRKLAVAIAVFVAPVLPWTMYLLWRFNSPVFPLYNGVFKSPYWAPINFYDGRWGPKGILETIAWPVLAVFNPERVNELNIYSGRMSLGCVVAVVALILARQDRQVAISSGLLLLSSLLWSFGTGYTRYGLYLDLLGGVLIVCVVSRIVTRSMRWRSAAYVAAAVLTAVFLVQGFYAAIWSYDKEWSGRPNCFRQRGCRGDLKQVLRDRSMARYERLEDKGAFDNVDVWIETAPKTTGFMSMLRPDVPGFTFISDYYTGTGARQEFASSLELLKGKRFFTLIIDDAYSRELLPKSIERLGFSIKTSTAVKIPYFSENGISGLLIELEPPASGQLR